MKHIKLFEEYEHRKAVERKFYLGDNDQAPFITLWKIGTDREEMVKDLDSMRDMVGITHSFIKRMSQENRKGGLVGRDYHEYFIVNFEPKGPRSLYLVDYRPDPVGGQASLRSIPSLEPTKILPPLLKKYIPKGIFLKALDNFSEEPFYLGKHWKDLVQSFKIHHVKNMKHLDPEEKRRYETISKAMNIGDLY